MQQPSHYSFIHSFSQNENIQQEHNDSVNNGVKIKCQFSLIITVVVSPGIVVAIVLQWVTNADFSPLHLTSATVWSQDDFNCWDIVWTSHVQSPPGVFLPQTGRAALISIVWIRFAINHKAWWIQDVVHCRQYRLSTQSHVSWRVSTVTQIKESINQIHVCCAEYVKTSTQESIWREA